MTIRMPVHSSVQRPGKPDERPGSGGHFRGSRALTLAVGLLVLGLAAALACGCDGSSDSDVTTPPSAAGPTPLPSPQITSGAPPAGAVAVVREFWKMVGEGRLAEAKQHLVTADSPLQQWTGDDIATARMRRVVPDSVGRGPSSNATIEFSVIVWIDPSSTVSPWGETGTHQLFENVVRMSDGTWRMVESGTGP